MLKKRIFRKPEYSFELERTLTHPEWIDDVPFYKTFERTIIKNFSTRNRTTEWREGTKKICFNYILLDSRITKNLPEKAHNLRRRTIWRRFISAIFYVGKGTGSRPYDHIISSFNSRKRLKIQATNERVASINKDGFGVLCLKLFHNIIPVEAYTREAAMIDALKCENLCNKQCGKYYGDADTWPLHQKTQLGVYLLYKAMMIFLNEGERPLFPSDLIDSKS